MMDEYHYIKNVPLVFLGVRGDHEGVGLDLLLHLLYDSIDETRVAEGNAR